LKLNGEDNLVSKILKKKIEQILLVIGFSLMFGIMILGQSFRQSVGQTVGILMNPVLAIVGQHNFHIVLLVMAAITGTYASLIQKYTIDWNLTRDIQERMKEFQKKMREAQLSQNTDMLKKLQDQQKDVMAEQMEMSKQQFKPMAYISIISIPLLYWVYYYISGHESSTMIFPFWGKQLLTSHAFGPLTHWLYWYLICSFGISQLIRKILKIGPV
jgi:uncharacterized membrane protein (DUF106 family)